MNHKSTIIKLILCFTCIIMIILLGNQLIRIKVAQSLHLQTAYIAKADILPRTCIQESDIQEIQVSGAYLSENVVLDKKDIIGKYTDIQGKIPAGSLFFRSMLYDASEISDLSAVLLKEGQCIFSLQIGSASSFVAGQRIDLYWQEDAGSINGILVKNIRILEIKDPQGIDIDNEESTGIPYLMDLAIRECDFPLVNQAYRKGTFTCIVTNDTYDIDLEAALTDDEDLLNHLKEIIQTE